MTEGTVDKLRLGQRRIIERPRLTRMLDDSPARIKMLVAPAGYGKTTLARQWLAASSHPPPGTPLRRRQSMWLRSL